MRNLGVVYWSLWAGAVLLMFHTMPIAIFPTWMLIHLFRQYEWHLFDIEWQSWKECLIPIAFYIPAHALLLGSP